jgi:hypothetical protein
MTATHTNQSRAPPSNPTFNSSSPLSLTFSRGSVAQNTSASHSSARLAETTNRPFTAVTAPTSVESQLQEAAHARPASSYTGRFNDTHNRTPSLTGPLRPPEYFTRPTSATSLALNSSASVYAPDEQRFSTHTEAHQSSRPETAMLFNRPDTADAALPPRRELPFSRLSLPQSAGTDHTRPASRPSTGGMMGPPPLPQRVANLRPASSRAATEPELPPLPKPTIVSSAQQQPSWMRQAPRTPENNQVTSPSTQAVFDDGQENRSLSSASSNFSPLSYKRATSNTSPPNRPLSSLSNSSQNRRHTASPSSQPSPSTPRTAHQSDLPAEMGNKLDLDLSTDLAEYAKQPEEDRRAALNEFLFKNLESENFLTLLEDMETCWARAGLGMK